MSVKTFDTSAAAGRRKCKIAVVSVATAKFVIPPLRTFPNAPYGAVATLQTDAHTDYVVASGSKVWIDVVGPDRLDVDTVAHERHVDCKQLHKVLQFKLLPLTAYTLQLSSSETPTAEAVVTPL